MNKIRKNALWILSFLSFLGTVFCYRYLPHKVPMHWNANWEVDGWSDKKYIFLTGLMPVIMLILLDILPKIDPRRENYRRHSKGYRIISATIVVLMIIMNWITIGTSLQKNIRLDELLPFSMGILFIILGNYMPVLKSNFFVGIKNPWTLSDDEVWRKTHKAGGYVFVVSGVLMIISSWLHNQACNTVSFLVLLLGLAWVTLYSYLLYRKRPGQDSPKDAGLDDRTEKDDTGKNNRL